MCHVPVHAMKAYTERAVKAALILNLSTNECE